MNRWTDGRMIAVAQDDECSKVLGAGMLLVNSSQDGMDRNMDKSSRSSAM